MLAAVILIYVLKSDIGNGASLAATNLFAQCFIHKLCRHNIPIGDVFRD